MAAKFDGFVAWFMAHKLIFGSSLGTISVILIGGGQIYGSDAALKLGAVLALVSTALIGGGSMKSDQFFRDRAEVLETRIDRRAPRSARAVDVYVEPPTIPQADLMKLAEKVEPDDPSKALKG